MKKLIIHPLFFLGLLIRLILIWAISPLAVVDWYAPFLDASTSQFTFDPWAIWLNKGGSLFAFPYGYIMWGSFLPAIALAKVIGFSIEYAYTLTLLAADFLLLLLLRRLLPGQDRLLLMVYWLSPIVILASYGFGLNDILPALLLTFALYLLRCMRLRFAGFACMAAISAKLSMLLALPFFFVYLFNNRTLRQLFPQFAGGLLLGFILLGLPFIASDSALKMLLNNPELGKIYYLSMNIGDKLVIYIVPLIYSVMLYMVWRVRRINYDLFHNTLGMAFLLVVLMTPSSPGWFIWAIPFLVSYQVTGGRLAVSITVVFSGLYALSTLISTPLHFDYIGHEVLNVLLFSTQLGNHASSLLHTAMASIGIILILRIWRETVSRNNYFRLTRKPFVIAVAGDSGSGKDTFSSSITGLFGKHSVVNLSGDNYHLWDRQKPIWQVMTHLNPMANDLESFSNDLVALIDGKNVQSKHYDHRIGKFTKPYKMKSNDFVIASGLHTLYLPILRDCYNLSIYLDIDESLRRHFKLRRDVLQRGQTVESVLNSLEKREHDAANFVRPQAIHADFVLSLQPIHPLELLDFDGDSDPRLRLIARTRHGLNELALIRVLIGVCGLHVDFAASADGSEMVLTIEGETSSEDIHLAAQMLCPNIFEFLDIQPKWDDGILGLMQLITLAHISQAMTRRVL
ncbi:uridine kinase [Undibacterium sp. Di26W]|uniref:uridine kinase n=1 Tax=Undibacterium sp. Di26W TaxID=3413035 RepID=UPI003BF1DBC3